MSRSLLRIAALCLFLGALGLAQVPTGTIIGVITDETGAIVPNAKVAIVNKDTGLTRDTQSGPDGGFSASALPAGSYEVRVEATGFRALVRPAEVQAGTTTTVNVTMQVGSTKDVVTVEAAAANINYDANTVQGVVSQQQIDNLPLNGRSYLNLAQLEPGVIVTPGNPAQFNAQFNVSVLGGMASHTAITVDGANIRNAVEGSSSMNFSQEIVQEFQLSSVNFDLSTGLTAFGAVNVVTRSGSNDLHGVGYFYFRDHNIGAYPVLNRTFVADPFFARRQSGFAIGGPIKRDRLFFFGNFEYTNQTGVFVYQPDLPSLAIFASAAPAPATARPFGVKFDYRMNDKNTAFLRYSHDGNTNQGPFGSPEPPSNFVANRNWVDQIVLGFTSVLRPTMVNDLRTSYEYWQNRNDPAPCGTSFDCRGPEITFAGVTSSLVMGNNFNAPQGRDLRRYQIADTMNWQAGAHRIKFGGEWEHNRGTGYWGFFDPGRAVLLSPEFLKAINVLGLFGLPSDGILRSPDDLNKLPVAAEVIGIGVRDQPAPFNLQNARPDNRYHLFAQDTWKIKPNFSLNFGMGWLYEDNLLNYDLQRVPLLAPLYGSDLTPPNSNYKNFSPAAGFAWNIDKRQRTVIRGGAGIFYDTQLAWWRLGERASLGPNGRQFLVTLPPFGSVTFGSFLKNLPNVIATDNAVLPGTGSTPQILISKQAGALGALFPKNFPTLQAQHVNIGVQHQVSNELVVTADFVYRHTIHETPGGFFGASVDYNHFSAVNGPVIPVCPGAPNDFKATDNCSNGPINFWYPGGNATYKALLVKVDKRFSRRYQFTASYALQDSKSINDITLDLFNYNSSYGPDLPRNNFTISGSVNLPWGLQASLISTLISRPPVQPIISGISINGSDTSSSGHFALPGMSYNEFISRDDLQKLVNQYNSTYAGQLTPAGKAGISPKQVFPAITLPSHYNLGHDFTSQDLRISKSFRFHDRYELRFIGEAFNILNIGNLTLDSFTLNSPAFGAPQQRLLNGSTFGSGGPRAFQFAGRFQF